MADIQYRRTWAVTSQLLVGDASRTIKANLAASKPGDDMIMVISLLQLVCVVSAAQAVTFKGLVSGNIVVLIPASWPVGTMYSYDGDFGIVLGVGDDFVAVPAAAGPAISIIAEGYIKKA